MKFKKSSVAMTPEILKRKLGGELIVPVTVDLESETEVAAGTPIDEDGKVTTTAPVGILLEDATTDEPTVAMVKAFAVVNTANCNDLITDTIKSALPLIVFE